MRCENKTFLQNDPGFLQEISSTAVEVGLVQDAAWQPAPGAYSVFLYSFSNFGNPRPTDL